MFGLLSVLLPAIVSVAILFGTAERPSMRWGMLAAYAAFAVLINASVLAVIIYGFGGTKAVGDDFWTAARTMKYLVVAGVFAIAYGGIARAIKKHRDKQPFVNNIDRPWYAQYVENAVVVGWLSPSGDPGDECKQAAHVSDVLAGLYMQSDGKDKPGDRLQKRDDAYAWSVDKGFIAPEIAKRDAESMQLTRRLAASIIYSYSSKAHADKANLPADKLRYSDAESIPEAYSAAVCWCRTMGITVEREDGKFSPDDLVSKAELAVMLGRLEKALKA